MDKETMLALADVLEYAAKRFRQIGVENSVKPEVSEKPTGKKAVKAEVKAEVEAPVAETKVEPVAESPVTIEEEPPAVAVSVDEMRRKCVSCIAEIAKREDGKATLVAFFAKFGAKRLSEITEEKMPEFYDGIREL